VLLRHKLTDLESEKRCVPVRAQPAVILVLENPRLHLTLEEAAQYLRVSLRTMHTLKQIKHVKYTRVRGQVRFRLQWLNEYLDKRTVEAAA
jgi:excisionase family DNA binding protein